MYVSKDSGGLYKEGEVLKLPAIAATLETLATEGAVAFYNGSLTKSILADITDHDSGKMFLVVLKKSEKFSNSKKSCNYFKPI